MRSASVRPKARPVLVVNAPSWYCMLEGQRGPLQLCHDADPSCARCMKIIASFLAREMEFSFDAAIYRSVFWYQAQLGENRCNLEQASDLRRRTALCCLRDATPDLLLADDSRPMTAVHLHTSAPDNPISVFGRLWRFFSARFNRGVSQ